MFYSNHHKKNSNLENKSKGGFEQNLQIGKFLSTITKISLSYHYEE